MTSFRADLCRITDVLLDPGSGPGRLLEAVNDLHALCSSIVGHTPEDDGSEADRETTTDHGRALSPRDAARCVLDFARTSTFLRGINEAIRVLLNRFPGRRINVLYAGCGPFAPLALPLTTVFRPEQIGITFLDTHRYSIDSVQRLIEAFDASGWCSALHHCDAVEFVQPATEPLHMVIIETMQRLLEKEPQVALTEALAPQLIDGGILIPERVRLTACLGDQSTEFLFIDATMPATAAANQPRARRRFDLGPQIDLTADGLWCHTEGGALTLTIPDEIVELPDLMLRTTVEVYGSHRLDDYSSGLTYPTMVTNLGRLRPGDRLVLRFEKGPSPALRVDRAHTP